MKHNKIIRYLELRNGLVEGGHLNGALFGETIKDTLLHEKNCFPSCARSSQLKDTLYIVKFRVPYGDKAKQTGLCGSFTLPGFFSTEDFQHKEETINSSLILSALTILLFL